MALLTAAEAKTILRIGDTTLDTEIAAFIPYVQKDLIRYLNNSFQDKLISYQAATIAFVSGSPDTITDSASKFVEEGFAAGMDIAVEYAYANTGIHTIATAGAAAGTLTLTSSAELVSMSPTDTNHPIGSVKISMVNWPDELKMVAAKMIYYLIDSPRPDDLRAETQDGVTLSYAGNNAYPLRILRLADKFKQVSLA